MKKLLLLLLLLTPIFAKEIGLEFIKNAYFKSYDYEKVGQYQEAIKVLVPLYKKYPKGYTLNLRFGWLFFLNKKYNNAVEYYNKAALVKPYSIEPKLGLIKTYLNTYQYQKAENVGNSILKVDYYNYYGNFYTIRSLIYQEKYTSALKISKKMLAIYPTDILFLEQLATIYKATKSKYLQQVYEDILILDPNNVLVRTNLQ
jgi:tetratricopeptide (TPR) repeat protein